MSEFINTADVIGDDEMCDQIIMRTVTEYKENRVTTVGGYAFYECTALTEVELPEATQLGDYAFYSCTALTTAELPKLEKIGCYAFQSCRSLVNVNFPKLRGCFGQVLSLFEGCTSLKTVYLPEFTHDIYMFKMFRDCTSLEELRMPKYSYSGQYFVANCKSLRLFDAGFTKRLSDYAALQNTTSLETLILRSGTVVPLGTDNSTLSASYTGDIVCKVYVPRSLIEQYKVATNWSAVYEAGNCEFIAIEGSEYE